MVVSVAAILVMAVLLAVLCVCLLGPRLLRLAADLCPCDLPMPLAPSGAHIPSGCRRSQADRGALEGCLMCDRGAAALTEQRRTLALSAQRDSELGLPPALPLPDGEEFPHSVNHIHIRTAEQEKEIYQAYIRPPPNRTIVGRQPSPSAVTSPSTPTAAVCARRPAASGAKSRPLTLESCQRRRLATDLPPGGGVRPARRASGRLAARAAAAAAGLFSRQR
ncbi:hypothetical protein FJT64_010567 [Amphibalanus amphitrite]|uniref:Uncharacterized protein n=1 Tax=Amphibalanus amphitrite TaxID=1232801 RepID=A0A6A4V9Q2_AMPAM|nr:hypothetical protein FJT64_010567 [Amphibalanus amphitrite]